MIRFLPFHVALLFLATGMVAPTDLHAAQTPSSRSAEQALTETTAHTGPDTLRTDRASTAQRSISPPTSSARWSALWGEVTSPGLLLGSMGPAVTDHLADAPSSWRNDVLGYGLRAASNGGRLLLEAGAAHGVAAATRLDLRFQPRGTGGIGARIRYAALEAVTARPPAGTRTPNIPRVVGAYGAALAQQQWQSGRVRPGDAALTTALGLGVDVVINIITEFTGGS